MAFSRALPGTSALSPDGIGRVANRASSGCAAGLWLFAALAGAPAAAQDLAFTDAYFDGDSQPPLTIDGLDFAWGAAVSSDGSHVYVCSGVANIASMGADDNAVAVFSRDFGTGELTFVEAEFDDQDGGTADGLWSCRDVEVSPDGKHVYTAGSSEDEIGLFDRNAGTGALTFVSVVKDGSSGVDGIDGVEDLVLSPDGQHLYAAGRADDAVAVFQRNTSSGVLTFLEVEKNGVGGGVDLDRPLAVDISPDGKHVYVAAGSNANFTGSDAVTLFARETNSGSPNFGRLTFVAAYVEGAGAIDGLDQLTDVKVSLDGKHVYTAAEVDTIGGASGNGNDWIGIFARNQATGALTWQQRIAGFKICPTSPFGADAESFMALGSDNLTLYVLKNWADNGVAAFRRDPGSGGLTFVGGVCELDPDDIGMNLPRKLAIDPLGVDLYVPGNASDAIVALSVCSAGFYDLDLTDHGVKTMATETACLSITAGGAGAGYVVAAGGDVSFTAPRILLTNGFEVLANALFTAANAVP